MSLIDPFLIQVFQEEKDALLDRNAKLVAALEGAAAFIAYELPVSGKGIIARIDKALADQQSTEKP